ncbi:hypothetical protein ACLOAV_006989 [Pseudogymnoascus australis]
MRFLPLGGSDGSAFQREFEDRFAACNSQIQVMQAAILKQHAQIKQLDTTTHKQHARIERLRAEVPWPPLEEFHFFPQLPDANQIMKPISYPELTQTRAYFRPDQDTVSLDSEANDIIRFLGNARADELETRNIKSLAIPLLCFDTLARRLLGYEAPFLCGLVELILVTSENSEYLDFNTRGMSVAPRYIKEQMRSRQQKDPQMRFPVVKVMTKSMLEAYVEGKKASPRPAKRRSLPWASPSPRPAKRRTLKTWNFDSVVATRNLLLDPDIAFDAARILRSVAWNLQMVAWKVYIVQQHHTKTTIFPTGLLLTTVVAGRVKTLIWLRAFENVVHTLRMTSCKAFMAAIDQAPVARKLTPFLWAKLLDSSGSAACITVSICRGQQRPKAFPTESVASSIRITCDHIGIFEYVS